MKISKSALPLLVLGVLLAGCSSPDANGVDISRPGFFNFLWSPPAPLPVSPLTPPNPDSGLIRQPLAVN